MSKLQPEPGSTVRNIQRLFKRLAYISKSSRSHSPNLPAAQTAQDHDKARPRLIRQPQSLPPTHTRPQNIATRLSQRLSQMASKAEPDFAESRDRRCLRTRGNASQQNRCHCPESLRG